MPAREKILVLMDMSEADKTVLKFVHMIANVSQTQEVHFLNCIKTMNIPEAVIQQFPDIITKTLAERREQMEKIVSESIDKEMNLEYHYHIKEGSPAKVILKFISKHNIDLIVMGRHERFAGRGVLSNRLARRASCSLFIIPENAAPNPKNVLVPCDYSPHSKIAMEEAISIAKKYGPQLNLICQNVYTVPGGYHYSGKSYEEFAKIMEKNAAKDFKKFMEDIDQQGVNIKPVYTLDKNDDPVEDILSYAHEINAGAIVIGVKGRTATTALFIGSKAETLIQLNNDIPMLVVRPKGTNAGFMDLLKEI